MYESGVRRPGAMAAILGDLNEPIETLCARATAEAGLVSPANYNCPGQIVISGDGKIAYRHVGPLTETAIKEELLPLVQDRSETP